MKALKYFLGMVLLLTGMLSCKKQTYDDVSLLNSAPTPSKLTTMFTITQDNSGMVTIYPAGESASYYEVFFGDATTAASKVNAGGNVQHKYA
ncbi:MAG: hypothetical protein WCI49_10305, partial [Ferruginibacter sp.]